MLRSAHLGLARWILLAAAATVPSADASSGGGAAHTIDHLEGPLIRLASQRLNGSICAAVDDLAYASRFAGRNCTRCPVSSTCTPQAQTLIDNVQSGHGGLAFWWYFLMSVLVCVWLDVWIAFVSARQFGEERTRLPVPPYTAAVFGLGILVVYLKDWLPDDGISGEFAASIDSWLTVSPEMVLLVLLPPLLFEDASSIDVYVFERVFWNCLLLATAGVMMCTLLSSCAFKLVLPWVYDTEITWTMSLLLGCILSATDPVAVIAVLKSLGAPERLSTLIAGESLLNDGSAVVVFLVLKKFIAVCSAGPTTGEIVVMSLRLSIGGPIIGALFFAFLSLALESMSASKDYTAMSMLVIATCYLCFYVAEHHLHSSGVLAVVVLGVLYSQFKIYLPHDFNHANHTIWQCMGWAATTVIFLVTGMKCAEVFEAKGTDAIFDVRTSGFLPCLFLLYFLLFLIRAFMLAVMHPITSRTGYGMSAKEAAMMTWGALRGAVSLAMALLIKQDAAVPCAVQQIVLEQVVGIVGLTLLINAPLSTSVYKRLNIYKDNTYRETMDAHAVHALSDKITAHINKLSADEDYLGKAYCSVAVEGLKQLLPDFREADQHMGVLHGVKVVELCDVTFDRHVITSPQPTPTKLLNPAADLDEESVESENVLHGGALDEESGQAATNKNTFEDESMDDSMEGSMEGSSAMSSAVSAAFIAMNDRSAELTDMRVAHAMALSTNFVKATSAVQLDTIEAFDHVVLINFESKFESLAHHSLIGPNVRQKLVGSISASRDMLDRQEFAATGHQQVRSQNKTALMVFWEEISANLFTSSTTTMCGMDNSCARLLFSLELMYAVNEGVVEALQQIEVIDDDEIEEDDSLRIQLTMVEEKIDKYLAMVAAAVPHLLQLVQTVFISRFIFCEATEICEQYRKHGVLESQCCDLIIKELYNRDIAVRKEFPSHASLLPMDLRILRSKIMCKRDPAAEAIKRDEALAATRGGEGPPAQASPATPPDAPDGDGATATTTPAPDATPMDDGDENNE